jgi:hypothetical protein
MTLESVLKDPELRIRVKRRVGPMLWGAVSTILDVTLDVLKKLNEPDPMAPDPVPAPGKPMPKYEIKKKLRRKK